MACAKDSSDSESCILTTLTEDHKRWIVFGIALNHVLVPLIRRKLNQEISVEYNNLKLSNRIDVQERHSFPAPRYPPVLHYENINANNTKLKATHKKKYTYDYSKFNYNVKSHVDFAKLFLEIHMAKFTAFDETCDVSAVLNLLEKIRPIFSPALQNAAKVVREGKNAWGHCNFTEWDEASFTKRFGDMENLVKELKLPSADEKKTAEDLNDWGKKGVLLCLNASVDADLLRTVKEHVCQLLSEVEKMTFDNQEEKNNVKVELENIELSLQRLEKRVTNVEEKQDNLEQQQIVVQQRVTKLENQKSSCIPHAPSYYISTCEADMLYNVKCYDPDTRQWLLDDFDTWFNNPKESRAYVLLGDAAVGKSVMAAVVAQRAKNDGNLAAAYFCRHYDDTRRDPRYLLGSIAYQMCNCCSDYNKKVGEKTGIQNMLANSLLGVHELFTKLLEEPLAKCRFSERKLVVIDALDESEHSSRDDFLDLIKDRFPQLPDKLLFFITSRPEDSVKFRLTRYNPCVRICAGNGESVKFYQQHEQDIQRFLEKRVNFLNLRYTLKEIVEKCSGMFLFAFYMVEILSSSAGLSDDVFPETINDFFRKNFKRVYETLGEDFYKKLFGCVLMAPSPLPISFISFLLRKEGCTLDEQEVIDAVSQFVQTTNRTFTFIHNLIPTWLTDKDKASRRLCINRHEANKLFRKIVVDFLDDFLQDEGDKLSYVEPDSVDYILHFGFRFIRESCSKTTVFNCLTNYRFLQQRIRSSKIGIYFLIEDLEFSYRSLLLDENKKTILGNLCSVLKREKHVIAGCPKLLSSCLSTASELTQETILRKKVSAPLVEPSMKLIDLPPNSIRCDIDCGAFSHDKKLFVGGQGKRLFLFDAQTFQKILGPIEVNDCEKFSHLEFSLDDKFVFFGRLDKWFSVHEKRVVEIAQFAGNVRCYDWGSFVNDGGSYIAVTNDKIEMVHSITIQHILFKWFFNLICPENHTERLQTVKLFYEKMFPILSIDYPLHRLAQKIDIFLDSCYHRPIMCQNSSCEICLSYAKWKNEEMSFRDLIAHLYGDIFRYQIWNLQNGRPVIEEIFCAQLKPFFFIWHFSPVIWCIPHLARFHEDTIVRPVRYVFWSKGFVYEFQLHFRWEFLLTNTPMQCYNRISKNAFSQDGKWSAGKDGSIIKLFRKPDEGKSSSECQKEFPGIEYNCFTNDSNYLLYVTQKPNPNLCAFSLHTKVTLQSISGLCPVVYESRGDKCLGYIFCCANERVMVSSADLSGEFFLGCLECDASTSGGIIDVIFTSPDTITFLFSNGMLKSQKIGSDFLPFFTGMLELDYLQKISVQKCAFSHDGNMIAINHSCDISLFSSEGKFLSLVFKITEQNACCLTFSPDDSLFLFCIEESDNNQSFYVWDIENKRILYHLSDLGLPSKNPVDCCCFDQDNSKIFFCNASSVFILHYPPKNGAGKNLSPRIGYYKSACSNCAVSFDNKLLVCCIANEILLHPLVGVNAFWKVPHNHLGKIECCRFLKGNRYLISCGIDGVVFLFDLLSWKPVAYTVVMQESIVTMSVSPDEDKIVCLGSSGKVSVVNLHGLKHGGLPSDFQLPEDCKY